MSSDITTPGFRLELNGTAVSNGIEGGVSSVSVHYELNQPTMFSFDLNMFDEAKGTWQGIDLKLINLGDPVKVSLGLNELVPMMEGEVTAIEPVFDSANAHVVVRGFDPLYKMRFGTRLHAYTNTTDTAVVKYLARKIKLSASANDAPRTKYPYLIQNNQSDYDFLLTRACRIGYQVGIEKGKLFFRKSQEGKKAVAELEFGETLTRFSARLRALQQGSEVEVRGWDQNRKQAITSVVKAGSEISTMGGSQTGFKLSASEVAPSPVTYPASSAVSPEDAKNMAVGEYNRELGSFLQGDGECPGLPAIRAGTNVELTGLGDKFSGRYYVTSAVHTLDAQGYLTNFTVQRTAV